MYVCIPFLRGGVAVFRFRRLTYFFVSPCGYLFWWFFRHCRGMDWQGVRAWGEIGKMPELVVMIALEPARNGLRLAMARGWWWVGGRRWPYIIFRASCEQIEAMHTPHSSAPRSTYHDPCHICHIPHAQYARIHWVIYAWVVQCILCDTRKLIVFGF